MALLVLGLVLFLGAHLVPSAPSLRNEVRERFGEGPYKGLFSLVSLAGLVMIVVGMARAPFVPLWTPPAWSRQVAIYAMPVALTLFIGAYLPSNLKRFLRHPMLTGVAIWAAVHLLANGDLAALLLFGGFGTFALFDIWSANRRGAKRSDAIRPWWQDILLIVAGGIVYMGIFHGHGWLFGVPVAFGAASP